MQLMFRIYKIGKPVRFINALAMKPAKFLCVVGEEGTKKKEEIRNLSTKHPQIPNKKISSSSLFGMSSLCVISDCLNIKGRPLMCTMKATRPILLPWGTPP